MDYIKEFGDKVSIMDVEDGLQIVNYNHCDNESEEDLKRVRGMVQEVSSGKVLFESFPYTDEFDKTQKDKFMEKLGNWEDWEVFYSMEGSLIRVFWYGSKWYISTNKKLNAYKSRWSSRKSFGDMFQEGVGHLTKKEDLDSFLEILDKEYVYFFLVRYNQENRVVCQVEKDPNKQILFIGRNRVGDSYQLEKEWTHSEVPMESPETISDLKPDQLEQSLEELDLQKYQGYIFFHKTKNFQVKIVPSEYKRLYQIRGNNPNIRFRYLEIRLNPQLRKEFLEMYPLSQDLFLEYENILYQIAKLIRIYYIHRYIKNKYVTLPKEEYILMKKCHEWYLSNREENRINVTKVLEILNQEDVLSMYKMIRRYQLHQNQTQEEQEYPHSRMVDPGLRARMTPPLGFTEV